MVVLIYKQGKKRKKIKVEDKDPNKDILLQINKKLVEEIQEGEEKIVYLTGEIVLLKRKLEELLYGHPNPPNK